MASTVPCAEGEKQQIMASTVQVMGGTLNEEVDDGG